MEAKLKTEIWVHALIRRCNGSGAMAVVARKGEVSAGMVLLKVNCLDGTFFVLSMSRRMDGERIWVRATGAENVDETEADAYIHRQIGFDPDLWVVEIEDREGRHFVTEPVE
jgi:hypothetical protein